MVEPIRIKSEFSFVGTTTLVSSRDKENDDIAEDDEDVASASHASSVLASFRPIAPKPASRRNPLIVPTAPKTFAFASPAAAKHASTTKHPFKYVCPFCGKRYTSRSGLLSHKNTIHYQRKPYRCQLCNDHFFTSAQRVAHIHRRHADQGHDIEATIMRAKPGMQQQQEQQQLRTKTTTHVVEKTYSRVPALSPMKKLALAAEASGAPKRVSIVSVSSSKSSIIMSNGKTITLDLGSQSSVELKKRLGSGGCVAEVGNSLSPPLVISPPLRGNSLPLYPQVLLREGDEEDASDKQKGIKSRNCKRKLLSDPEEEEPEHDPLELVFNAHQAPHVHDRSLARGILVPQEYKCMECLKAFVSTNDLLQHLVQHRPLPPTPATVTCVLCEERVEASDLAAHTIKKHVTGGGEVRDMATDEEGDQDGESLCSYCGKVLASGRWKKIHLRYHHRSAEGVQNKSQSVPSAKFECAKCASSFSSMTALSNHRSYFCEGVLRCTHCDETAFSSASALLRHCSVNHSFKGNSLKPVVASVGGDDGVLTPELSCPLCKFNALNQRAYLWHMSRMHKIKSVGCSSCEFACSSFESVVGHMRSSHGVAQDQAICLVKG